MATWYEVTLGFQAAQWQRICLPVQETQTLGQEDPPEKEVAAHSCILAQRIPWTEEPGRLQSWGHKESDTTEHTCAHTA